MSGAADQRESDEPSPPSPEFPSDIVPRATVRDMVRRRDKAIDLYGRAFLALAAADKALTEAGIAYKAIDLTVETENAYTYSTKDEDRHFIGSLRVPSRDDYAATARKIVDRKAWATVVRMTDLEKLMDKQAKDQLRQQLQEQVPEVTEENVWATLQQFAADADTIFKRGIANTFTKLDRRFRTHDGWKIGSRVILSYCFDEWGSFSYRSNIRDTLHDIDRTFQVLDGKAGPAMINGIVAVIEQGRRSGHSRRQSEHDSEYFKIRCYKNGNAHVWFKRDDLVEKVNRLLGEYYGAPIPEAREPDEDTGLHQLKTALAKRYGFFPTPDRAAEAALEQLPVYRGDGPALTVLEPSAGTGNLASRAARAGTVVDCIECQPTLADGLRNSGLYRNVRCGDFLAMLPGPSKLYDRVFMNPPFDRERDIDHVMHAVKFLKPDGCLVAIMSAGTEFRETRKSVAFRALMEKMGARWRDLPAGSFSSVGTNVNTVILRVWNDARRQW
jgi:hypothetical protein